MITYNHENYIAQAIEGVLMQKTNFPIELVIGEDASTDNTRKIILDYKEKYPDLIRLKLHKKNVGMHQNFIDTLSMCNYKYIAFCEGDDYMIDKNKLEKQFQFLENNSEYVLCCHNVFKRNELENSIDHLPLLKINEEFDINVKDLLQDNIIPSLSIFFRNKLLKAFPDWVYKCEGMDWPLYMLISKYGKFRYLPFVGAVYREHPGGVSFAHKYDSEKRINVYRKRINALKGFKEILEDKFHYQIKQEIKNLGKIIFNLMYKYEHYKDLLKFTRHPDFDKTILLNLKVQLKLFIATKKIII